MSSALDEMKNIPLRIERNAVAREKFGVTWDKLAQEYLSCHMALISCNAQERDYKCRLEPYYNRDGTRKRLKFDINAIIGMVLLTALFSSPVFTVFVSDVIWYRMIPIPWTMLVGIITYNLLKPHPPIEYRHMKPDEIKRKFERHEHWKQAVNDFRVERDAIEAKFSEVDSVCGGNSAYELKGKLRQML